MAIQYIQYRTSFPREKRLVQKDLNKWRDMNDTVAEKYQK